MQVSAWMIRMEADIVGGTARSKLTVELAKKEITNRAAMFIQVRE